MNSKINKDASISRRRILPILGSSLLIPLFGFGKPTEDLQSTSTDEEYQTLLKSDGTTVKVKTSTLKNSKILIKNVSNKSFLKWLGRKL